MEGSSATVTRSPPLAPVMAEFMKPSAQALRPTCFMQAMARRPM